VRIGQRVDGPTRTAMPCNEFLFNMLKLLSGFKLEHADSPPPQRWPTIHLKSAQRSDVAQMTAAKGEATVDAPQAIE